MTRAVEGREAHGGAPGGWSRGKRARCPCLLAQLIRLAVLYRPFYLDRGGHLTSFESHRWKERLAEVGRIDLDFMAGQAEIVEMALHFEKAALWFVGHDHDVVCVTDRWESTVDVLEKQIDEHRREGESSGNAGLGQEFGYAFPEGGPDAIDFLREPSLVDRCVAIQQIEGKAPPRAVTDIGDRCCD
jgi:hypothetical protein